MGCPISFEIKKAFEKCNDRVVPATRCGEFRMEERLSCSWYISAEVRSHIHRAGNTGKYQRTAIEEVINALFALHRVNIAHGDPRIPNIVVVNSTYKWIDLRMSVLTSM